MRIYYYHSLYIKPLSLWKVNILNVRLELLHETLSVNTQLKKQQQGGDDIDEDKLPMASEYAQEHPKPTVARCTQEGERLDME